MRKRTQSREYALQLLYQLDLRGQWDTGQAQALIDDFWDTYKATTEIRNFARELIMGTLAHRSSIDDLISQHAQHWHINRMAVVDRNILRLGVFELMHLADVPPKVSINEAIELAKRFGDAESAVFINGLLDAIHKAHVHQAKR